MLMTQCVVQQNSARAVIRCATSMRSEWSRERDSGEGRGKG